MRPPLAPINSFAPSSSCFMHRLWASRGYAGVTASSIIVRAPQPCGPNVQPLRLLAGLCPVVSDH